METKESNNWISVNDERPNYYKPVMVYSLNTPSISICWRASDGERDIYTIFNTDYTVSEITHWQPLPSPPTTHK